MTHRVIITGLRSFTCVFAVLLVSALPSLTHADDSEGGTEDKHMSVSLGLDPALAKASDITTESAAPPKTERKSTQDWEMGFHGYLRVPMRFSFDKNMTYGAAGNEIEGEETIYESPPMVPDATRNTWDYTGNLPVPFTELMFSFGNSLAVGTVTLATENITDGSYRNLKAQLGIDQAWVALKFPNAFGRIGGLKWDVGIFQNRYGAMGRYDAGRYDTYIFGRTHVAGETLTGAFRLNNNLALHVEHGFGVKIDVLPKWDWFEDDMRGEPSVWMPYHGGQEQGTNFINHAHIGLIASGTPLADEAIVAAHLIHSFTADGDPSTLLNDDPSDDEHDGSMLIAGADVKVNGAAWGDLYIGAAYLKSEYLNRLADGVETLHSRDGWNVIENYFGPHSDFDGNGSITTLGFNYNFSLSRLVWALKGKRFWGQGPNFQLSLFGMVNFVRPDERLDINNDGVKDYVKTARYTYDQVYANAESAPGTENHVVVSFDRKEKQKANAQPLTEVAYTKFKWGLEGLYTPLSWLSLGLRYDQVHPIFNDDELSYSIYRDVEVGSSYREIDAEGTLMPGSDLKERNTTYHAFTPQLRIRTAFVTHEEVTFKYVRYFHSGKNGLDVRTPTPDSYYTQTYGNRIHDNAFMLSIKMWW